MKIAIRTCINKQMKHEQLVAPGEKMFSHETLHKALHDLMVNSIYIVIIIENLAIELIKYYD
jgi:hypothetical protein